VTDPSGAAEPARPRRSVLYMPGANERALQKARGLAADALILDLEDAVAPEAKQAARERVSAAVGGYGRREVVIRVNARDTPWHADDVRAAAAAGPDAVLVPKVGGPADVRTVAADLVAAGAPEHTRVWAMVETPSAVLHAEEIAHSDERLAVLVMGTNDLVNELRARHVPGRAPLLPSLALCLLAARAGGLAILDGVYNDVRDAEGFEAECRVGRDMGFDGKTLVHPGQIEPCNRAYAPTEAELAAAREVLEAWEAARAAGIGVLTVGGRMVENLHVDNARRLLAANEAIQALAADVPRS
jgi:citrate lyase subunit beta/citryl-CoA lyase